MSKKKKRQAANALEALASGATGEKMPRHHTDGCKPYTLGDALKKVWPKGNKKRGLI